MTQGGDFEQIATAAFTGAVMGYFGASLGAGGWTGTEAFYFGVVGGITSVLQGGKFGHGFVSAYVGAAVNASGVLQGQSGPVQFLGSVVVGGTVSKATGGKFSNGAAYAAFAVAVEAGTLRGRRNIGSQKGSSGNGGTSNESLEEALESLMTDKEFVQMRKRASDAWGKDIQYKWTSGESYAADGVVYVSDSWSQTSYETIDVSYPEEFELLSDDEYWKAMDAYDNSIDVSTADGIQRPFSLKRIIYHETAHLAYGPRRMMFHSESNVIHKTNDFMKKYGELPRKDHRMYPIDK